MFSEHVGMMTDYVINKAEQKHFDFFQFSCLSRDFLSICTQAFVCLKERQQKYAIVISDSRWTPVTVKLFYIHWLWVISSTVIFFHVSHTGV